jgi:hypothetical protein
MGGVFEDSKHIYYGLVYSLRDINMSNIMSPGTLAVYWQGIDDNLLSERNSDGSFTGLYGADDSVLSVSYGKELYKSQQAGTFMSGVSVKFYEEKVEGYKVKGEAFDVGMLWALPETNVKVGAAVRNIGSKVKYFGAEYDLPLNIAFGVSSKFINESLTIGFDVNKPIEEDMVLNYGGEYWFMNTLAFRLGYNRHINKDNGLNGGVGLSLKDMDVFFFYIREIAVNFGHERQSQLSGDDLKRISVNIKFGAD